MTGRRGDLPPRLAAWAGGPRRVALAWAVGVLAAAVAGAGGPGISRDEAALLAAAGAVTPAAGDPASRPVPPLAPALARTAHALAATAGVPHRAGWRLGAALAAAALAALVALLANALAGPAGALLAPALLWAAPRHLQLAAVATPEVLAAALGLGAVLAYRRAELEAERSARLRAALAAGLLFGAALLASVDAWVLLPVVALHAAVVRLAGRRARAPGAPPSPLEARLQGVPAALAAMAVLGPLLLLALWPAAWREPLRTLAAAMAPRAGGVFLGAPLGARPPLLYPWGLTALTVPAALLFAYVAGLVHAAARLVRIARGTLPAALRSDEVLLLALALGPLALVSAGLVPLAGGVRPWLLALPAASALAARAILSAARAAWPERSRALAASLALLVLYPAARATGHAGRAASSAWNELAGGAPGAAALGLARQDGGESAAAVLGELAERARPGARVYWPGVAPAALAIYGRDGALASGLARAATPEEADLAVVPLDGGSRDAEYQVWSAFRTAHPVAGAFHDEVPLVFVYARPGAWR